MSNNREDVLAVLKGINAPGGDIVSSGVMRALTVDGGTIRFVMEINPSQAVAFETVKSAAEEALGALEGIDQVSIVMTGHTAKAPPDLGVSKPAEPKGPAVSLSDNRIRCRFDQNS